MKQPNQNDPTQHNEQVEATYTAWENLKYSLMAITLPTLLIACVVGFVWSMIDLIKGLAH